MLLSVENLHVYYGAIHAVKDVSLHVQEGEIVTLIGANGAGKSTVLNTISGLLKPRSGNIQFMDHNVTGVAPNKILFDRHSREHAAALVSAPKAAACSRE